MEGRIRTFLVWFIWLFVIAGILLAGRYLLRYLSPFVIAFILTSIIDAPVNALEHRARLPRSIAVFIMLLLVVIVLGIAITIGILQIYSEVVQLSRSLPLYEENITRIVAKAVEDIERFYRGLPPQITDVILMGRQRFYDWFQRILVGVTGIVTALPNFIIILTVSFIAAYFMSKDKEAILNASLRLAPKSARARAERIKDEITRSVMGLVRAECILISITTIITIIGLSILGFGYAWLLGILAGILDLLPFVGVSVIFIPMIVYNAFIGNVKLAILILVLFGVVVGVRQAAEPRVIGIRIGIHPLATLVSIYVGIQALGAAGFIVGPLALVILKALVGAGLLPLFPKD